MSIGREGTKLPAAFVLSVRLPTSRRTRAAMNRGTPCRLFQFGIIADVQYADKNDSVKPTTRNDGSKRVLYFRNALNVLSNAVDHFNREKDLDFVVQLGDIIDGNKTTDGSRADLQAVLDVVLDLSPPIKHTIGNHCRAIKREELCMELELDSEYYSLVAAPGWEVIVLNGADVLGTAVDSRARERSLLNDMSEQHNVSLVPWAGGVGSAQLRWFENELDRCARSDTRVIVCCHYPVVEESSRRSHVLINSADILQVLDRFPGTVVAWFSGHDHLGGYACREGVHHVTFEGAVESEHEESHAIVTVLEDGCISIRGYGSVSSRNLTYSRMPRSRSNR